IDRPTRVPSRIQRAILRGLEADPAARFPTMADLLRELARDPRAGRARAAIAVFAAAIVALSVLFAQRASSRHSQICRRAEAHLDGVWDAGQRKRVEAAFLAVRSPYAASVFASVAALLDRFAADWVAMRTDACEAARVRGEQSEQVQTLRMACLDTRLKE